MTKLREEIEYIEQVKIYRNQFINQLLKIKNNSANKNIHLAPSIYVKFILKNAFFFSIMTYYFSFFAGAK